MSTAHPPLTRLRRTPAPAWPAPLDGATLRRERSGPCGPPARDFP